MPLVLDNLGLLSFLAILILIIDHVDSLPIQSKRILFTHIFCHPFFETLDKIYWLPQLGHHHPNQSKFTWWFLTHSSVLVLQRSHHSVTLSTPPCAPGRHSHCHHDHWITGVTLTCSQLDEHFRNLEVQTANSFASLADFLPRPLPVAKLL